jgi:hypothetical protein
MGKSNFDGAVSTSPLSESQGRSIHFDSKYPCDHEATPAQPTESTPKEGETNMRVHRFAATGALWLVIAGTGFAQSPDNTQTPTQTTNESKKQLKQQEKADKDQAKADKSEKKALSTKQQKKADKDQEKANKAEEKANTPPNPQPPPQL